MKEKKENIRVREKPAYVLTFLNFWNAEKEEVSEEEGISQSDKITQNEKNALLKSLKDVDEFGEETFSYSKPKRRKKQSKLKSEQFTGEIQEQEKIDKVKNEKIEKEDSDREIM